MLILTRQCYPSGLCPVGLCPGGLLTWGWRQIFNHLYKVKGEDGGTGADLPASPLVSNVRLQLDHIPLGERQLVTVLPLEVKPRHTSRTTSGEARTFQTSGHLTWTNRLVQTADYVKTVPDGCRRRLRFPFREGFRWIWLIGETIIKSSITKVNICKFQALFSSKRWRMLCKKKKKKKRLKGTAYQDFDVVDRKEASGSSAGASVPLAVHLLHRGHNVSCSQTQLTWTLCRGRTTNQHQLFMPPFT